MISTLERPLLINQLHERLVEGDLPGASAHQRMAHAVRKVRPEIHPSFVKEAGILIILFEKAPGDLRIVFIRRGSSHEQDKHAGQIGFPGGKKEDSDPDMMYTAMREAEEEISVDLTQLDVLGALTPLYITVSKYMVYPFVAYARKLPGLVRQEAEIEEILVLPLSGFRAENARINTRIHLMPGMTLNHVPCFSVDGHIVWGATAMVLNELLELLDKA